MKFLFDVCAASLRMQRALERRGHDVRSAVAINPRATDDEILAWATAESGEDTRVAKVSSIISSVILPRGFGQVLMFSQRTGWLASPPPPARP